MASRGPASTIRRTVDSAAALRKRTASSVGPGAAAVQEFTPTRIYHSPAARLALLIAVGIGLHNFAEGLAIGQSAASGETSLALLLVIGFGLHNATEGFGIVAPMAAGPGPIRGSCSGIVASPSSTCRTRVRSR